MLTVGKIVQYLLGIILGALQLISRKRDERLGKLEAQNEGLEKQADRAEGRAEINAEVRKQTPDDLERELGDGL